MSTMPREIAPDSTLQFLLDPYRYISRRCAKHGSDCFRTRIMLRETICLTGAEGAALFYDTDRLTRHGAAPGRIQKTLFGIGGVQGLDGSAHRRRKAMFMALLTGEGVDRLELLMSRRWDDAIERWSDGRRIALYDELVRMLGGAVCEWMGIDVATEDLGRRADQLRSLYDHAGNLGPAHHSARRKRRKLEKWISGLIEEVRDETRAAGDSPLEAIAEHRDEDGERLDPRVAAVDVLNVLRPTVAIAVYITLAARQLLVDPSHIDKLRAGGDSLAESYAQETRRHAPFFPLVAAVTKREFDWKGRRFPKDVRVLLDLYGTNHDERLWSRPERFEPARFVDRAPGPFELIPQGGGDHRQNHRCPGEWITLRLMRQSLDVLVNRMEFTAPAQGLGIDFRRLPALPRSRVVLTGVRRRSARS